MLRLVPWYWRVFGVLGLLLAALCAGWFKRGEHDQVLEQLRQAKAQAVSEAELKHQQERYVTAEIAYAEAVQSLQSSNRHLSVRIRSLVRKPPVCPGETAGEPPSSAEVDSDAGRSEYAARLADAVSQARLDLAQCDALMSIFR